MAGTHEDGRLRREVGLGGAVLLGLGSMLGTGVFLSLGLAADVAGTQVLLATGIAALLAAANGLSSAQLAAAHPVSGGTYEYGHVWLTPTMGFAAGWLFLLAKSASAATASLALVGYGLDLTGWRIRVPVVGTAVVLVLLLTALVAGGIRRSNRSNAVLVGLGLLGLVALVVAAAPHIADGLPRLSGGNATGGIDDGSGGVHTPWSVRSLLHASALMFVAYTGYGRIATLGEEVRDPRRVIPRAIVVTVSAVAALYLAVGAAGLAVLGPTGFGESAVQTAAPLVAVAQALGHPWLTMLIGVAAVAAMAGVLLNLLLGLSRVVLAMGRRGDAPGALARVHGNSGSPVTAVWVCGALVAALALTGNVAATWSFSAFTVLVYYALTNLAALRLGPDQRLAPRWISAAGLVGCLGLAFWVDTSTWLMGLGALTVGLVSRAVLKRG